MLAYYLTAAIAFTLGFLAAAAIIGARRATSSRDRAWLAAAIERFVAKCKSGPSESASSGRYLVERDDLEALLESARAADPVED